MLGLKEELQIRQWAREEWDKKETEKQSRCEHLMSGSLRDGVVYCDACGKALDWGGDTQDGEPSRVEQRGIDALRGAR